MNNDYANRYRRPGRLYRSHDSVFFGVCGGIAERFDFSPWAVRILFLLLLLLLPVTPWLIAGYVGAGLLLKKAPVVSFRDYGDEEFYNAYQGSRSEALRKVGRAFDALDRRLQRMETIVTSRDFELEDEYKKL